MKERLVELMTMDADPNQTLTTTQRAELKALKQIESVGSPGPSFESTDFPSAPEGFYYARDKMTGKPLLDEDGKPYVVPISGTNEDVYRKTKKKVTKELLPKAVKGIAIVLFTYGITLLIGGSVVIYFVLTFFGII
jgi:hypothetical protein